MQYTKLAVKHIDKKGVKRVMYEKNGKYYVRKLVDGHYKYTRVKQVKGGTDGAKQCDAKQCDAASAAFLEHKDGHILKRLAINNGLESSVSSDIKENKFAPTSVENFKSNKVHLCLTMKKLPNRPVNILAKEYIQKYYLPDPRIGLEVIDDWYRAKLVYKENKEEEVILTKRMVDITVKAIDIIKSIFEGVKDEKTFNSDILQLLNHLILEHDDNRIILQMDKFSYKDNPGSEEMFAKPLPPDNNCYSNLYQQYHSNTIVLSYVSNLFRLFSAVTSNYAKESEYKKALYNNITKLIRSIFSGIVDANFNYIFNIETYDFNRIKVNGGSIRFALILQALQLSGKSLPGLDRLIAEVNTAVKNIFDKYEISTELQKLYTSTNYEKPYACILSCITVSGAKLEMKSKIIGFEQALSKIIEDNTEAKTAILDYVEQHEQRRR